MKRRSGMQVMLKLVGLVKPLAGFMVLAILMGLAGHLCAAVDHGARRLCRAGNPGPRSAADARGGLRLRRRLCAAARRPALCGAGVQPLHCVQAARADPGQGVPRAAPALPGKARGARQGGPDRGHHLGPSSFWRSFTRTRSRRRPLRCCFRRLLCVFIGSFHPALGLLALAAYVTVGVLVPLFVSKASGDDGNEIPRRRRRAQQLRARQSARALRNAPVRPGQGTPAADERADRRALRR